MTKDEINTSLFDECKRLTARIEVLEEALLKLSCLGNGDKLGNSEGNLIAQRALTTFPEQDKPMT